MDKLITDKKNMYQVKAALDRICYELSTPIQKQCLKMVDEYTDEIIQMFVNEVKCHEHLWARLPNDGFIWLVVNLESWNFQDKLLFDRRFEWQSQI